MAEIPKKLNKMFDKPQKMEYNRYIEFKNGLCLGKVRKNKDG